ncbi:MAG TPA: glycosyltransferase family 87 protein [Gemmatimonadaceae bacterium]|nr:glycosyltransferase family 87 protein [Gemmatimonadaceae bacterium]
MNRLRSVGGTTVGLLVLTSIVVRVLLAGPDYNHDFTSYRIVASIMERGGNVYAETDRYNYGPIWFWVLHLLDATAQRFADPTMAFRLAVASFLSLVDIGLFAVIYYNFGRLPAMAALLNPVAILISGYHGQFDNLAVLLAMLAVLVYDSDQRESPHPSNITKRRLAAYCLLGLSLMVKHVFFAFPVWLALRERRWGPRAWAIGVPIAVFLMGFLPYWRSGGAGIVANVFLYTSRHNAPLWNTILPSVIRSLVSPLEFFLGAVLLAGYLTRRWQTMDALLIYSLVLVAFSPAMTNQYLAIVVPAIAVFSNIPFVVYTVATTVLLMGHKDGLRVVLPKSISDWAWSPNVYQIPILVLFVGTLWVAFDKSTRIRRAGSKRSSLSATGVHTETVSPRLEH